MNLLTCRQLIDFLDDYVEGTQPPDVRAAFEQHLSVCKACRDYLATYRDTIRLTRASGNDDAVTTGAPADLVRAILRARTNKS